LDTRALRLSLDEIVRRHDVLRTVVELVDGAPMARILEPGGADWSVVDVSDLSGAARDARVRELVDAEVQRPFELASDVLLRALLIRMAADEHVLVIVSHHVASDDRSKRIVAAELEALYRSYSEGSPASVPELPLQYGQFARWEQARLSSAAFRKDIDYWKQRLSLSPPPLELPTDFSRPSHWNYEGATFTSFLDAPTASAVKELTVEARATLFMVLEAAFVAVLSRVATSDDVVIGTPVSGRTHPELDDLVGYFSNTLVMRHDLADDPSFRELVERVRGDVIGAFEHQSVPFERLVEELGPERDPGRHPFFQVMFTVRPGGVSVPSLGDLTVTPFKFRSGTTKFDLSLITIDEPTGIRLVWEYSTRLFSEASIARLAERFETLLLGALTEPDAPIKDLPLVGPREMDQLLEWGSGPVRRTGGGEPGTLVSAFRTTAESFGASVAVRDSGGSALTFAELDAASARLSRHLAGLGVTPGDRVGVYLDRSVDLISTLVGIQRAGAAYVPLDPDYPADRVAFVLSDAAVSAVVTRTTLIDGLGDYAGPVVDVDADRAAILAQDASDPGVQVTPDSVAYVIYTSGSTGRPKGVVVPHRGVVNILTEMAARPGLSAGDVMVGPTTPAFPGTRGLWPGCWTTSAPI
jgi:hypothetical protein